MFGLINLNKPAGKTSRDAVNHIQRLCRPAKVGHAGTLDPLATGVLVIGVGPATRLVEYEQRMPKRYRATFLLGQRSDTEDISGDVQMLKSPRCPSAAELAGTLPDFLGDIQQRPPAYSALKVQGRRAYDLARRGESVQLAPRTVRIDRIEILQYDYPELQLDVICGSGTYIRSLGRDLAQHVGTEAVMAALERTAIGSFRVEQACRLEDLSAPTLAAHLLPPALALGEIPAAELSDDEVAAIHQGRFLPNRWKLDAAEIAAMNLAGQLVAILGPAGGEQLKPLRNFPMGAGSARWT